MKLFARKINALKRSQIDEMRLGFGFHKWNENCLLPNGENQLLLWIAIMKHLLAAETCAMIQQILVHTTRHFPSVFFSFLFLAANGTKLREWEMRKFYEQTTFTIYGFVYIDDDDF